MAAGPVNNCFKHLFAIFHDHLSPEKRFLLFNLMLAVLHLRLILTAIEQNKVNC